MYPFGMKVRVRGVIRPAYIIWVDSVLVHDPAKPGSKPGFRAQVSKPLATPEMRRVNHRGTKKKLEGEALPASHPVPNNGKAHRRLRRHKAYHEGVVVGWTWRSEGELVHDDPNYLLESRRQWGHEVALNYYLGTKHAWVTKVVFCLVEDLDPFDL